MIRLCHDPGAAGSPPDHVTYGVLVGVIDLAASDDSCGAKARRLGVLARAGFDVPAGFVVTADVSVNDPSVAGQVAQGLDRLTPRAVAVRSSAGSEDGATASFAGQFESVLGVVGADAVAAAVERCATSGRGRRARWYAARVGLPTEERVPVIVQRLVDADASGVAFTRDPVTGRPDVVVNASWGLGPSVVDGVVTPDSVRVSVDGRVEYLLGSKASRLDLVEGRLQRSDVPPGDRKRPCLSRALLRRLVREARRAERVAGRPLDLEWAVQGDRLWILQARPITRTGSPTTTATRATTPVMTPHEGSSNPSGSDLLVSGTPSSPGRASGPARLVHDVDDFAQVRRGDVLVCRTTDPAWTPLFSVVAAVVTETGGLLSHAAIVAREMGIPAVVGAAGALAVVPRGRPVVVDGARGTVSQVVAAARETVEP
jgi:pyruvate, water dikinase